MSPFRFNEKYRSKTHLLQILKTLAQREIDLLKKLTEKQKLQKRGLMQKLLTGQWRVNLSDRITG